jgi:hypothetical protein
MGIAFSALLDLGSQRKHRACIIPPRSQGRGSAATKPCMGSFLFRGVLSQDAPGKVRLRECCVCHRPIDFLSTLAADRLTFT